MSQKNQAFVALKPQRPWTYLLLRLGQLCWLIQRLMTLRLGLREVNQVQKNRGWEQWQSGCKAVFLSLDCSSLGPLSVQWIYLPLFLAGSWKLGSSLPRLLAKHGILATVTCLVSCPNYTKMSLSVCDSVNSNSRGQETSTDKHFGWKKQIKRHHLRELRRKNHQHTQFTPHSLWRS